VTIITLERIWKLNRITIALAALTILCASYTAAFAQQLRIIEPASSEIAVAGASVRLVGRWDGEPAGVSFRWSSDVDGVLEAGLESIASALSYAVHRIRLEALAADTVLAAAETTVFVISSPEQFTLSERIDWEGEFSHSGRQVAYTSYRTGDPEVMVADVENRYAERITFSGGRTPVWSPDNRALAFWSERSGSRDILYVELGRKPREARRLTGSGSDDWCPAFHPSENKIAYISKQHGQLRLMQLELGAEDTSSVELVGTREYPMFPRWRGDGQAILFTSFADSLPVLKIFSLENGSISTLGPLGCEDGDISADGSRVLAVKNGELYLLSADGVSVRPLTRESGGVLCPRFSPDGTRAIFATTRSGNYDLWLLNLPSGR
jgi:Tol biopolymer transport system component